MTYPDETVIGFLNRHFIFLKIDLDRRDPALAELYREVKPLWAPLFRATTSRGSELRRWFGFLPPADLIFELELVLAHDLILERRELEACDRLDRAILDWPDGAAAPEAMFWMGVAAFKAGDRNFEALEKIWSELIRRWPDSTWATRADVMEMRDKVEF